MKDNKITVKELKRQLAMLEERNNDWYHKFIKKIAGGVKIPLDNNNKI